MQVLSGRREVIQVQRKDLPELAQLPSNRHMGHMSGHLDDEITISV
jgi:hypothetical protein